MHRTQQLAGRDNVSLGGGIIVDSQLYCPVADSGERPVISHQIDLAFSPIHRRSVGVQEPYRDF